MIIYADIVLIKTQNPAGATPSRFDSDLRHQWYQGFGKYNTAKPFFSYGFS